MTDRPNDHAREENPFPGPRPFEPTESQYFFGREAEKLELTSMILANRVVFLYAQSGAGKTSLLNACLLPALRDEEDFDVLPVARLGVPLPAGVTTDQVKNVFVFNALRAWRKDAEPSQLLSQTLGDFLFDDYVQKTLALGEYESRPAPRVLVFDQFEELFTTYPERWKDRRDFFVQLARALDPNLEEWRDRLKAAGLPAEGSEPDRSVRILFSLREDHLANLHTYADLLPVKPVVRVRIERLRKEAACEAAERPAGLSGRPFDKGVADQLVTKLVVSKIKLTGGGVDDVEGEFVEPVQLQIICKKLFETLPAGQARVGAADLQRLGDVNEPLIEYYEKAVRRAVEEAGEKEAALRDWFEHALITPAGTRGTVFMDQKAEKAAGIRGGAVGLFESLYLVRGERRAGGLWWYELTHDRFIEPILQSNNRWREKHTDKTRQALKSRADAWSAAGTDKALLLDDEELKDAENWLASPKSAELGFDPTLTAYIKTSRAELDRARLEYKTRTTRRLRYSALALAVLTVFALGAAAVAQFQSTTARRATREAQEALKQLGEANRELTAQKGQVELKAREAIQARATVEETNKKLLDSIEDANEQREIAEAERLRAEDQQRIAEGAKQAAVAAAALAEQRRGEAERDRALAETRKKEAEAARALAEQRRGEAEAASALASTRSKEAEAEKEKAEKFSRESFARGKAAESRSERDDPLRSVALSVEAIRKTSEEGRGEDRKVVKEAVASLREVLPGVLLEKKPLAEAPAPGSDSEAGRLAAGSFSKDSSRLLTVNSVGRLAEWSLGGEPARPKPLREAFCSRIGSPVLSPHGKILAFTTSEQTGRAACTPEAKSGNELLRNIELIDVECLADAKCTADASRKSQVTIRGHQRGVFTLAFDGNDEYLATSDTFGNYGVVKVTELGKTKELWDKPDFVEKLKVRLFQNPFKLATTLAFGRAGAGGKGAGLLLATGFQNGDVVLRDVRTGGLYARLPEPKYGGHTDSILAMAFNPASGYLVTSSRDNHIKQWTIESKGKVTRKELLSSPPGCKDIRHDNPVTSIAFNAGGSLMATGSEDRTVIIWKADPSSDVLCPVVRLPDHKAQLIKVTFSPDGKRLATLAGDDRTRIWDISSLKEFLDLRDRAEDIYAAHNSEDITGGMVSKMTKLVEDITNYLESKGKALGAGETDRKN